MRIAQLLVSCLVSAAVIMSAPAVSLACGNAVYLDGDEAAKRLKDAQLALEKGNYKQVDRLINDFRYRFDTEGSTTQTLLLSAAGVRQAPNDNVLARWKRALEYLPADEAKKPLVQARLAEILAYDTANRAKAFEILEDLLKRDLMPDAYSFAVLGSLRTLERDSEGAKTAFSECRRMTRHKRNCKLIDLDRKSKPASANNAPNKKAAARKRSAAKPLQLTAD